MPRPVSLLLHLLLLRVSPHSSLLPHMQFLPPPLNSCSKFLVKSRPARCRCSPLDAVDALLGLATRYGVPAEGRLPRALAPYHETLGALGSVALRAAASPKGQAALTAPGVQTVVEAFAALGGPRQGQAQGQRQGQGQGQGPTRARAGGPGQRQGPAGVRAGGPGLGQGRRRPSAAGHNTPASGQKAAGHSTPAAGQKAAGHNTPAAGHKTAKKSV